MSNSNRIPTFTAADIIGVQPMTGPVGQIFTLRMNNQLSPPFNILAKHNHENGKVYYELTALGYVKNFIREQDRKQWFNSAYGHTIFVDEKLLTILGLKF